MIEHSYEIFSLVAAKLRAAVPNISVVSEYISIPAEFPCVSIDEIENLPSHLDSAARNKYADVRYRVQVFSNKQTGKRAQCREIYAVVDDALQELGFICRSYSTMPDIYASSMYSITAVYEATLGADGTVYRRS